MKLLRYEVQDEKKHSEIGSVENLNEWNTRLRGQVISDEALQSFNWFQNATISIEKKYDLVRVLAPFHGQLDDFYFVFSYSRSCFLLFIII